MDADVFAGKLTITPGCAYFEGSITENDAHKHTAFQLTVGIDSDLAVHDGSIWRRGPAFLVAPAVPHYFAAIRRVRIFYVEPHTVIAARWRARYREAICAVPELCSLTNAEVLEANRTQIIDERLRKFMALVSESDHSCHLNTLAAGVGLSPQRLRALAQQQLGVPLRRWRAWERIKRAVEALSEGASLVAAAHIGGFADQAHFTRGMKAMFGLTPAAVQHLFRSNGRIDGDGA